MVVGFQDKSVIFDGSGGVGGGLLCLSWATSQLFFFIVKTDFPFFISECLLPSKLMKILAPLKPLSWQCYFNYGNEVDQHFASTTTEDS